MSCLSLQTKKIHKAVAQSKARQAEILEFWEQDTVSTPLPTFKPVAKRFAKNSVNEMYRMYTTNPDFHKKGKMSRTTFLKFRPGNVKPMSKTPWNQCLCEKCRNCMLSLEALRKVGLKDIPKDLYELSDRTLCPHRLPVAETDSLKFARKACIFRQCNQCGWDEVFKAIRQKNNDLIPELTSVTYNRWVKAP